MSWQVEKALDDLMAQERGAVCYPFGTRHAMAICYPNTYDVAMSNLGMQIIYREVNGREDWLCERAFLPDKDLMKVFDKTGEPLISLENRRPLSDFEILGLSVSFEMDYFNVPKILEMGRIPILAADRGDEDTLVVMGGPVAFFNAEPLSPFVDVVLVGEGEHFIHSFLDAYGEGKARGLGRHELLRYLAIHVPVSMCRLCTVTNTMMTAMSCASSRKKASRPRSNGNGMNWTNRPRRSSPRRIRSSAPCTSSRLPGAAAVTAASAWPATVTAGPASAPWNM